MKRRTKLLATVGVLFGLFSVFAVSRLLQRDWKTAALSPAQAEAAYAAAMAEPTKALLLARAKYKQTPDAATEAELQRALKVYREADKKCERLSPYHFFPYRERVPAQLRYATRSLVRTGNVFRFAKSLRHALLPVLDREG